MSTPTADIPTIDNTNTVNKDTQTLPDVLLNACNDSKTYYNTDPLFNTNAEQRATVIVELTEQVLHHFPEIISIIVKGVAILFFMFIMVINTVVLHVYCIKAYKNNDSMLLTYVMHYVGSLVLLLGSRYAKLMKLITIPLTGIIVLTQSMFIYYA